MGNNTDRSYWLRTFALAIYAKSPIDDEEGCVYAAEQLLSAIERSERESAPPDPTTRELVDAAREWRGDDNPNYFGDQAARLMRAIIAYDAAHPNPPSDGSVVASDDTARNLSHIAASSHTPSPGTEDAQAGHLNTNAQRACVGGNAEGAEENAYNTTSAPPLTLADANPCGCGGSLLISGATMKAVYCRDCNMTGPWRDDIESAVLAWNRAMHRPASPPRALTDTDRELFDALSGFDWSGAARSDQRKRVRKGWDAIRAWLEWYTARRDDPTAALREAYRDACVKEIEVRRVWLNCDMTVMVEAGAALSQAKRATKTAKLALDAAQKGGAK